MKAIEGKDLTIMDSNFVEFLNSQTKKFKQAILFRYRFEVEESLIAHITKYKEYQNREEKLKEIAPEMISDFSWAYQIIDEDNKIRYPQLESQTKEMLMSGALTTFMDKKYYQALIGKCDYARSFITSEYLYHISVLALDKNLKTLKMVGVILQWEHFLIC